MCPLRAVGAIVLIAAVAAIPAPAHASRASVAAPQAGLQSLDHYRGYVDGIKGPLPRHAVSAFQHRHGLLVDGVAGPQTRRALGWRGRPALGSRAMQAGERGWGVGPAEEPRPA